MYYEKKGEKCKQYLHTLDLHHYYSSAIKFMILIIHHHQK